MPLSRKLRPRRSAMTAVLTAMAIAGSGGLSGCGTGNEAGPVQPVKEQGHLIVEAGSMPVPLGRPAVSTAYLINTGSGPVTLLNASPVAVPGYKTGYISDIAVASTRGIVGAGAGWPPSVPVRPFRNARINPGNADLIFGILVRNPETM